MNEDVVVVENLSVRFGGVKALTDVSLRVAEGSAYGIIGPNGAGKTTLFNCISGFIRPSNDSKIRINGLPTLGMRVDQVSRLGVGRTFQNISLVRSRSVRENIVAGYHQALGYGFFDALFLTPRARRAEAEARRAVEDVANLVGISPSILDQQVDSLSLGLQKKVEVARALIRRPRLLLLDEPAGGLNDAETADLMASLKAISLEHKLTIVLIDHDMSFVMPLCNEICVLNFGHRIAIGSPDQIARNQAVIDCYLGTDDA